MPWNIQRRGPKFCVVKKGETEPIPGGCHPTQEEAKKHMAALYAAEGRGEMAEEAVTESAAAPGFIQLTVSGNSTTNIYTTGGPWLYADGTAPALVADAEPVYLPGDGGRPWAGPIAFEGKYTGDKRIFGAESISWLEEALPLPFRWVKMDSGQHLAAVVVGRVDNIWREDEAIMANGVVLTGESAPPEAAEYVNLLENDAAGGVSIDGDDAEFSVVETETGLEQHFTALRLRGLTAVDIPAFIDARIALTDIEPDALAASCADDSHFAADAVALVSTAPWNGAASRFSDEQYRSAAAGCDPGDGAVKQRCFLPHHEPGGALNVNGLHAAAQRASQLKGRSPAAVAAAKGHLRRHYGQVGEKPPDSLAAGDLDVITAAAIPVAPPEEWFTEPAFDGPTPVTVAPDGRVSGHLALFDTCHIAMAGGCVNPPRGNTYDYFHTGEVETAEGSCVAVGHLTFDTGHADMRDSALAAASHYDNTGTVAADVRAGEDDYGPWVVGALRPTLTDEQIRAFRAAPLSGDWRRIAGRLELVAVLAVNTPGFPVPRTRAKVLVASGHEQSVIAMTPDHDFDLVPPNRKARIVNGLLKSELGARVNGGQ
jgi:hypothetical protein